MIKAIIFDLDGVLVDAEKIQTKALLVVLSKFKVVPSINEIRKYEGALTEELIKALLGNRGIETSSIKQLAEKRRKLALRLINSEGVGISEGAMQLLSRIKNLNLKIAVATAASRTRAELILEKTGIGKYVDILVTGSDVGKGKPNPEIFLLAAKRLKVYPSECLVIEDSENGVVAAKSAGMFCVAKDSGTKQNLAKADRVVKSLSKINVVSLMNQFKFN